MEGVKNRKTACIKIGCMHFVCLAAAEESVRRQVQELHAAKQPLQTFPLALLDLDAKRAGKHG